MLTNLEDPNEHNDPLLDSINRHRIFENRLVKYALIGTGIIGTALIIGYFSHLLRALADPPTIDSSSSYSSVPIDYEHATALVSVTRTHTSSLKTREGGLAELVHKPLKEEQPFISY